MGSSLSQNNALFFGQQRHLLAIVRAASIHLGSTSVALDKQEVASFISAVGMRIARLPALVATSNDLLRDAFSQSFIEHEILSYKFHEKVLLSRFPNIFQDTTFHVADIPEAVVKHIGTRFLTPNTTRAIHDDS